MLKRIMVCALLMSMTGCGLVYVSPSVDLKDPSINVVPLDGQAVERANSVKYKPRQIPAVFFQNSGTGNSSVSGVNTVVGSATRQDRPGSLVLQVPPAASPGAYRIGVGDVLLLATKSGGSSVEELSGLLAAQNSRQGYTVQDDGAIAVPGVGRVMVEGQTLEGAEAELFQRLVENQIDPTFSLEISEFNSKRVSIGGAVNTPIVAPITLTPLYLDEAISKAGGISTVDLDYATIRIYRNGTLYQIPVKSYLQRPSLQRQRLLAGDSIFVDTAFELVKARAYFEEQIALAQLRQSGRAQALGELESALSRSRAAANEARDNFRSRVELDAVGRDHVYLTGEFVRPGRFPMPFGRQVTLADALYSDGGFRNETANPSQIYVLRGGPRSSDAVTAYHLNASKASNMLFATKMYMNPNDVIFVAEQPITKWNRALQQIFPTLLSVGNAVAN